MQTQISALKIWQLNKWADMDGSGKFVFWLPGWCSVWLSDLFMFPSVRAEEQLIKCRWVRRGVQVCSLSSVRSHLCDSISPSVKWGHLLSRCWTSRKEGKSAVPESWFWKWIWAMLWSGKAHWCLKNLLCRRLWENGIVWNICKTLPLWVYLHPYLVYGGVVESLLTLNHLSVGTDPFICSDPKS